jgi:hypothetical protein
MPAKFDPESRKPFAVPKLAGVLILVNLRFAAQK